MCRAYDMAAIKLNMPSLELNFASSVHQPLLEVMPSACAACDVLCACHSAMYVVGDRVRDCLVRRLVSSGQSLQEIRELPLDDFIKRLRQWGQVGCMRNLPPLLRKVVVPKFHIVCLGILTRSMMLRGCYVAVNVSIQVDEPQQPTPAAKQVWMYAAAGDHRVCKAQKLCRGAETGGLVEAGGSAAPQGARRKQAPPRVCSNRCRRRRDLRYRGEFPQGTPHAWHAFV